MCWGLFLLMILPGGLFTQKHWEKKIGIFYALIILLIILGSGSVPSNLDEAIDKKL
jgi:hypothetical protein